MNWDHVVRHFLQRNYSSFILNTRQPQEPCSKTNIQQKANEINDVSGGWQGSSQCAHPSAMDVDEVSTTICAKELSPHPSRWNYCTSKQAEESTPFISYHPFITQEQITSNRIQIQTYKFRTLGKVANITFSKKSSKNMEHEAFRKPFVQKQATRNGVTFFFECCCSPWDSKTKFWRNELQD